MPHHGAGSALGAREPKTVQMAAILTHPVQLLTYDLTYDRGLEKKLYKTKGWL
jgi:hypothetical protein